MAAVGGASTHYGMGWYAAGRSRGVVHCSGGSIGGVTQLVIYPEAEVVVGLLTNSSRVDYADTHHRIAYLFMPEPLAYLLSTSEVRLQSFLGDYLIDGDTPARCPWKLLPLFLPPRQPQLLIPRRRQLHDPLRQYPPPLPHPPGNGGGSAGREDGDGRGEAVNGEAKFS